MSESYAVTRRGTTVVVTQTRLCPVERSQRESFEIPLARLRTLLPELAEHLKAAEEEATHRDAERLTSLKARRDEAQREIAAMDAEIAQLDDSLAARLIASVATPRLA